MKETEIQQGILLALGSRPDLCKVARRNRGTAKRTLGNGREQWVKFGDFEGGADITGILCDGRRLEVEVKGAKGRQEEDQKNFEAMIRSYNGVYVLARSVEEAVAGVEAALGMVRKKA